LDAAGHVPLDVHVVLREPASVEGAFLDADGRIHAAYGVGLDGSAVVVLDANVRVVAAVPIDDAATAVAVANDAVPATPSDDGVVGPGLAPVLVVPDALAPTFRDELVERWSTEGSVDTGVETVVEGERVEATDVRRKRRRDHIVTDPQLLRRLTQHVGARVFPELQKAFAFAAGGFEGFKIGCYTADDRGHFEAHRDNLSAGTAHRRFGLSLNLNDDYTGGELRFPEYGAARYRPAAGEALLFSGSHLHEVLPVEHGRRFVLLSFVLARRST
jgi:predicted 2-oxoglutarate/Fe(II)-dependent dioxygenase YbiX